MPPSIAARARPARSSSRRKPRTAASAFAAAQRLPLLEAARRCAEGASDLKSGPRNKLSRFCVLLDELAAWLWQGPELARVDDVSIEEVAPRHFSGFETG